MGRLGDTLNLYRETLRWAWTRSEVQKRTSRQKILYFFVIYGSWLVLMVGIGLVLHVTGYTSYASGFWYFGIGFSLFMMAVDIAWEAVTFVLERREERAEPAPDAGSQRELAPDFHVERDTWVGFFVTVIALIVLVGIFQLILFVG